MNDIRKTAKIALVGVAMYVLTGLLMSFLAVVIQAVFTGGEKVLWVAVYLGPTVLFGAMLLCLFGSWGDRIAARVVGKAEPDDGQVWWLPAAFRLVCVILGVLCLNKLLAQWMVTMYMLMDGRIFSISGAWIPELVRQLSYTAVWLAAAVYLLYGAPHFVRWQVKKTLEQCRYLTPKTEG